MLINWMRHYMKVQASCLPRDHAAALVAHVMKDLNRIKLIVLRNKNGQMKNQPMHLLRYKNSMKKGILKLEKRAP